MCTTTSIPTTPTNAKSSRPCEKAVSGDALSAMIGATAEAEEEVEDDGTTMALAKGGVTALTRTARLMGQGPKPRAGCSTQQEAVGSP